MRGGSPADKDMASEIVAQSCAQLEIAGIAGGNDGEIPGITADEVRLAINRPIPRQHIIQGGAEGGDLVDAAEFMGDGIIGPYRGAKLAAELMGEAEIAAIDGLAQIPYRDGDQIIADAAKNRYRIGPAGHFVHEGGGRRAI